MLVRWYQSRDLYIYIDWTIFTWLKAILRRLSVVGDCDCWLHETTVHRLMSHGAALSGEQEAPLLPTASARVNVTSVSLETDVGMSVCCGGGSDQEHILSVRSLQGKLLCLGGNCLCPWCSQGPDHSSCCCSLQPGASSFGTGVQRERRQWW